MLAITRTEAVKLITDSGGQDVFVVFRKRTTGETREMNCKYGIPSTKGGKPAYDFGKKGLICIFDTDKQDYRTIAVEGLVSLSIKGISYKIQDSISMEENCGESQSSSQPCGTLQTDGDGQE